MIFPEGEEADGKESQRIHFLQSRNSKYVLITHEEQVLLPCATSLVRIQEINNILKRGGIEIRPPKVKPEDITVLTESEKQIIASAYREGTSAKELSSQYNISPQRVNRILAENGVEKRDHSETCSLWERDYSLKGVQDEVAKMYESGKYLREIANHYQVSNNAVITCLEKAGVDRRSPGGIGDSVQGLRRKKIRKGRRGRILCIHNEWL